MKMTLSNRTFNQTDPRRQAAGSPVLFRSVLLVVLCLFVTPPAVSSQDIDSLGETFDGCGTVVMDKLYYCYLFQADEDGSIYHVAGIDPYSYDLGDRLHIAGIVEDAASFCTIDGRIIDETIAFCVDECAADFDGDGIVDVLDLLNLLAAWGSCSDGSPCPQDLDQNGLVDIFDLLQLLGSWGACE